MGNCFGKSSRPVRRGEGTTQRYTQLIEAQLGLHRLGNAAPRGVETLTDAAKIRAALKIAKAPTLLAQSKCVIEHTLKNLAHIRAEDINTLTSLRLDIQSRKVAAADPTDKYAVRCRLMVQSIKALDVRIVSLVAIQHRIEGLLRTKNYVDAVRMGNLALKSILQDGKLEEMLEANMDEAMVHRDSVDAMRGIVERTSTNLAGEIGGCSDADIDMEIDALIAADARLVSPEVRHTEPEPEPEPDAGRVRGGAGDAGNAKQQIAVPG